MIHAVIDYCKLDLLPVEQSAIYKSFVLEYGEELAKELVYEVIFPPLDDDE